MRVGEGGGNTFGCSEAFSAGVARVEATVGEPGGTPSANISLYIPSSEVSDIFRFVAK
jgi:hypothetical protein